MLYPKNKEKELSDELYASPTSEYRGAPFWAWNCALDKKELLRQMEVFKKMGFGGAHMHVRTGLDTPYLSGEFFDCVSACVSKARREKMKAWLYDEDRWPSGAAGGIVTKDERFRQKYLLFTKTKYNGSATPEVVSASAVSSRAENGVLIARFDVRLDENGRLGSYRRLSDGEKAENAEYFAYLETSRPSSWFNNQTYVNTLDKDAMKRFIEVTYEAYAGVSNIRKAFGKEVPAIFTDEPQFTKKSTLPFAKSESDVALPWTADLEETFSGAYGDSITDHIPELIWEAPSGVSVHRYRYHDHIAERFAEAFADQCGAWCAAHGIMLTGHMMQEPTLGSQTAALGEAMRSYRSFALPGIDMLCARHEFTTAKQCQSAVNQYGREGMLSELYGVTGWDFDFRGHKHHGDWQAALGVTVRVPHLSWVSMKGEAKRDYPASISYQSSWWTEYSYVEDHFARVNAAMTRGKPAVRVGVIHPVESYWLHWGPSEQTETVRSQLESNFKNVTEWLLFGSIDFDFISESLLPSLCKRASAPLKVGKAAYDAIVVPACETLRSTTVSRLSGFLRAGGRLIFMGDAPRYVDALPSEKGKSLMARSVRIPMSKSALLEALEDLRTVDMRLSSGARTSDMLHRLRKDGDDLWLFAARGAEPYSADLGCASDIRVLVKGVYEPVLYDTVSGTKKLLPYTVESGKTVVSVRLYGYDSLLIRYCAVRGSVRTDGKTVPSLPSKPFFTAPEKVKFSLSEPNVLLLDTARWALDGEEYSSDEEEVLRLDNMARAALSLPPRGGEVAQPWVLPHTEPSHRIRLLFTVDSEISVPVSLALEDADKAQIFVGGKRISASPSGFYVDKSIRKVSLGTLGAGKNEIEVVLPFGEMTNVESCFLLGDFGVRVEGSHKVVTTLSDTIGFDDITRQGLPFYGGVINYEIPVELPKDKEDLCDLFVQTPHYRGAVLTAKASDENGKSVIAYPPYVAHLGKVSGKTTVTVSCFATRQNCFGHVHNADERLSWIGPHAWRSEGEAWTYSYRLRPQGLLSAPLFYMSK